MRQLALLIFGWLMILTTAQADYKLGLKHQVKNDALEFETVELFMDGKFAGFIYENTSPIAFSKDYYVYATCPIDNVTREPDGYCINWNIYENKKKSSFPLTLPDLTSSSIPSFFWPYIAYVKVPRNITQDDFNKGFVEVSCVVVKWPKLNVIAQKKGRVNVGIFETDAPGSFTSPIFTQNTDALEVTCSDYSGGDNSGEIISKVVIPTKP